MSEYLRIPFLNIISDKQLNWNKYIHKFVLLVIFNCNITLLCFTLTWLCIQFKLIELIFEITGRKISNFVYFKAVFSKMANWFAFIYPAILKDIDCIVKFRELQGTKINFQLAWRATTRLPYDSWLVDICG